MKYKYKKLEFDESRVNELGSEGWRVISVLGSSVIMELEEKEQIINPNQSTMPVARTISDPGALYKCMDKVKRYEWGNHYESTEFLTIDEFKNDDFYTDDGEYEAFLSDGFYFLGTDISIMSEDDELDKFIEENKSKFLYPDQLKVYYIDYPEDK